MPGHRPFVVQVSRWSPRPPGAKSAGPGPGVHDTHRSGPPGDRGSVRPVSWEDHGGSAASPGRTPRSRPAARTRARARGSTTGRGDDRRIPGPRAQRHVRHRRRHPVRRRARTPRVSWRRDAPACGRQVRCRSASSGGDADGPCGGTVLRVRGRMSWLVGRDLRARDRAPSSYPVDADRSSCGRDSTATRRSHFTVPRTRSRSPICGQDASASGWVQGDRLQWWSGERLPVGRTRRGKRQSADTSREALALAATRCTPSREAPEGDRRPRRQSGRVLPGGFWPRPAEEFVPHGAGGTGWRAKATFHVKPRPRQVFARTATRSERCFT
jgi:hypothetical protein